MMTEMEGVPNDAFEMDKRAYEARHPKPTEQTRLNDENDASGSAEKRRIRLSLALVFLASLLVAAPLFAVVSSATSILMDENLGIASLAIGGIVQVVATALFTSFATKVCGVNRSFTFATLLLTTYVLSYFYPSWATTVPAGLLLGVGQALFFCSLFLLGNTLGFDYARVTGSGEKPDAILALTSGLMNSALGAGFLVGNGLLFVILDPGSLVKNNATNTDHKYAFCGADYCNEDMSNTTAMQPPVKWRYYTMVAVLGTMAAAGAVASVFTTEPSTATRRKKDEYCAMVKETWLLLGDTRGYLLILVSTFLGLEQSFMMSDFNQAFVSCSLGIPRIGLIMMAYGLTQLLVSSSQWVLVKCIGRPAAATIGVLLLAACFIILRVWSPSSDQVSVFFLVMVTWATGDAITTCCICSVYALLFQDNMEGAFSLGAFWVSFGQMMSFLWSAYLCMYVKLYILMAAAFLGLTSYLTLEVLIHTESLKKLVAQSQSSSSTAQIVSEPTDANTA